MADKSFSARIGHITRHIRKNEPLKGKTLEFALELFGDVETESSLGKFLNGIVEKFKKGQALSEYEQHIMLDAVLIPTG